MFEKKRGKRFLASVMALVMLLSLAPVGTLAAENKDQQENPPVTLPANGDDQKPVMTDEENTENTNEETTPPPANKGIAALPANNNNTSVALPETPVIVKPAEVLDKDNGIAEYKGNNDGNYVNSEPTATEKMAELWITNAPVTANDSNSVSINSDIAGITTDNGVLVSELAPEKGRSGDNNVVFWQARILDSNHKQMIWQKKQTKEGHEAEAFRCMEITNRSSSYYQLQYKNENNAWTNIESSDQIVFYYTAVTNLLQDMIQINITDWPRTDGGDNTVTYEVYVDDENTPTNQITTYYNTQDGSVHGRTTVFVDNVSVDMNQLEKYKVKKIERQYANQNAEGLSVNDSRSNFSIDLDNGNCTIKIYLERYKYVLNYELNEGSIASGTTYTLAGSYKEDETITAPASESMSRAGYTFDGWYMDDALENPWTGDKMPSKDLTLHAKWSKNSYTVTYKDGDAQIDPVGTVEYNNKVTVRAGLTKDGHTFKGWKSDYDEKTYSAASNFTMPAKNVILTAVWEPVTPTKPETETVDAKYFILIPRAKPTSGADQGSSMYLPNENYDGGVRGAGLGGYSGKLTKAGAEIAKDKWLFNADGVDPNNTYLILPAVTNESQGLGYFDKQNWTEGTDGKYTYTYKGSEDIAIKGNPFEILGQDFDANNIEIVWYVIKNQADGYHVDGYVKGIPITLTYHENFGTSNAGKIINQNINGTVLNSGDKVTIQGYNQVFTDAVNRHEGWEFVGWFTKNGQEYEQGETTLIDSVDLYARWTKSYDVVTHFMDANGDQKYERTKSNLSGVHGTLLKDMVLPLNQVNTDGITGNYVYVPSETKYSINDGDKIPVGNATYTEANTVIHQYYYLDETGKTNENGKDTNEPNNYPDAWEYKATFIVKNGQWDTNPTGGKDTIVKYLPTKNITTGESIQAKLSNVPTAGNTPDSHYKAGSWDDQKPNEDDVITKDMTYTYTYSWRSSGGSGGGSRPTVTIPDDVPTGLNGTDHYAYIIGYGNNDVRPQNNITRAEVATIFFRLLTDETREANMTKSNSYNDVKDGDWFCCAVSTLSKMGIIKGYEDGSFKPNDPISRAEFAAIAARFDPDGDKTPATFADVTSHWAKDEISIAANHGWIKGYEDGSFKPDQKITRAETMTLVNRVLNRLPETKDDLHKDMKTWVDNMDETAWYYLAVQEATNSHYFKNKTSTKFEQWTDLRDTRDWSELEK